MEMLITDAVVRHKNPRVDLRRKYAKMMGLCSGITLVLHMIAFCVFPRLEAHDVVIQRDVVVVPLEEIPETRQVLRPPAPPRPVVPIAVSDSDVPDEVTIPPTDLEFDAVTVAVPTPDVARGVRVTEEDVVLDYSAVEQKAVLHKNVLPVYPEIAKRNGLEGTVYVQFVVGKNGHVKKAQVVKGPEAFREAALRAVFQWVFRPAKQDNKRVSVWMVVPIEFKLDDL